jgi:hypothetical protein
VGEDAIAVHKPVLFACCCLKEAADNLSNII